MARILIVDDSSVSRKKLKEIIKTTEHEIIGEAGNGHEAFEKYEALQPDLVTMDITMPDVDGITALKQILASYPEAKVVMISALGNPEKILEALNAGAKNYITKPFEADQIVYSLKEALKS